MYELIAFKKFGFWIAAAVDIEKTPDIYWFNNIPYCFSTAEDATFVSVSRSRRKALDQAAKKYKKHSQKLHSP